MVYAMTQSVKQTIQRRSSNENLTLNLKGYVK